jgi:hypothetical protein
MCGTSVIVKGKDANGPSQPNKRMDRGVDTTIGLVWCGVLVARRLVISLGSAIDRT